MALLAQCQLFRNRGEVPFLPLSTRMDNMALQRSLPVPSLSFPHQGPNLTLSFDRQYSWAHCFWLGD